MNTINLCNIDRPQMIVTQDLPDEILKMIQSKIARLQQEYQYILNCRVSVAVPKLYPSGIYQVKIVINLADRDLTIDREPTPDYYQEDIYVAIWSAFDLARKKLKEYSKSINYALTLPPTQPNSQPSIRTLRRCYGYAQG